MHLDYLTAIVYSRMYNQATKNRFAEQLRGAGFKATPAKVQLLAILATSREPLSVDTILRKFKNPVPDIVTIYRSLKSFHVAGLIRQVNLQHGHAHYEYADKNDHHHFICNECGVVEDIKNCNLDSIMKKALKDSKNFEFINDHSFEIFGLCKNCNA